LGHNFNEHEARDKPANMGPKGNATAALARGGKLGSSAAQKLHQEPITQDNPGRQPPKREKENQRDKRQHTSARIEQKIRAHYAGDRATGADAWHGRNGIE